MAHYVTNVVREIAVTAMPIEQPLPLATVFFGGGTPSLVPTSQLARVLSALEDTFGIATGAEIAIEIDPATFNAATLADYRALGINRVSLGVQAFQDELLAACGRSHRVEDIWAAIAAVRASGIENFSLDLISGLPHQTPAQWAESLEMAIAAEPTHLSSYDLTVEAVTPFGRQYQPGASPLPDDETTAQMYRDARQRLTEAGFEHYEISNYARAGYQCRHNRVYWENCPFYGFGMGAASYVGNVRALRPRTREAYFAWVEQLATGTLPPVLETTPRDRLLETLMLGLRLAEGMELDALAAEFGEEVLAAIAACLRPYADRGWVEAISPAGEPLSFELPLLPPGRLRLRDPEGFLFSNVILSGLFEQLGD